MYITQAVATAPGTGGVSQADFDALLARVVTLEAFHMSVGTHTRYFGWKTTRNIVTADLDATLARVNSSTSNVGEWPATAVAAYPWVAVPMDAGEPTQLFRPPNPVNQISGFPRQTGTVDDGGGVPHIVLVSQAQLTISTNTRPVTLGYG